MSDTAAKAAPARPVRGLLGMGKLYGPWLCNHVTPELLAWAERERAKDAAIALARLRRLGSAALVDTDPVGLGALIWSSTLFSRREPHLSVEG